MRTPLLTRMAALSALIMLATGSAAQLPARLTKVASNDDHLRQTPQIETIRSAKAPLTSATTVKRAAAKAQGVTEFILIDEDFSGFTQGTPDEPFCEDNYDYQRMLCSYTVTPPGLYIDNSLTQDPGWTGGNVFQAGGTALLWGAENDWAHLNTPLGDYSGDITVKLRARAIPSNYVTSEIQIAPMIGGFLNIDYAKTDDPDGYYSFRLRDYEGWVEMTYTFRNTSADANGFIGINASGAVEIDWIKVTCNPSEYIAAPKIQDITNVTANSFTANWDMVDNAFTYLVFLDRLDYLSDEDAVYEADFEGETPLDLPEWTISLGEESGVVVDEDNADNHVLCLHNGDAITAPEYIAKFRDIAFYLKASAGDGYLYIDLKKDGEWLQNLGMDLYWFTYGETISLDYEMWGDFKNQYEGVRLRVGGMPQGAYLLIDNLKATTSPAGVMTPVCLDPEFQEYVDECNEWGIPVEEEYLAWWLSRGNGDECDHYTFTDLDPMADYYYKVVAQRIGLRSASQWQRAFVVATPELLPATDIDAQNGAYTANWTACPKATSFTVNNYIARTTDEDGMITVLEEDFKNIPSTASMTSPDDHWNYWDVESFDSYTDLAGWSGLGNSFAKSGLGCVEAYYVDSWMMSPVLFLGNNTWTRLTLRAYGQPGGVLTVRFGTTAVDIEFDAAGLMDGTVDLNIGGCSGNLKFYASDYGAFVIDYIKVEQEVKAGASTFQYVSSQELDSEALSAIFTGLDTTASKEYAFNVTATRTQDGETTTSTSPLFMIVNLTSGESRLYDGSQYMSKASLLPALTTEAQEIGRYTIDGRAVTPSYHGLVIVRYSDGTARKLLQK
ncbi:MAG: hypothetical protein LIO91_04740 [Bacteroidales bacterium]|nr:hypothetical protein [Bacteroidales bacterium]